MRVQSVANNPAAAAAGVRNGVLLERADNQLHPGEVLRFAQNSNAVFRDDDGYENMWIIFADDPHSSCAMTFDVLRSTLIQRCRAQVPVS